MKNYNYYYYIGMRNRFNSEEDYVQYINELTEKLSS